MQYARRPKGARRENRLAASSQLRRLPSPYQSLPSCPCPDKRTLDDSQLLGGGRAPRQSSALHAVPSEWLLGQRLGLDHLYRPILRRPCRRRRKPPDGQEVPNQIRRIPFQIDPTQRLTIRLAGLL